MKTESQLNTLQTGVSGWSKVGAIVKELFQDQKGRIVCELDAPAFTQKFIIGKRGSIKWKYRFIK